MSDMNFDELMRLGTDTRSVKIGKFEFKLKTLSSQEQIDSTASIPSVDRNPIGAMSVVAQNVLIHSIVSINDESTTKQKNMEIVPKLSKTVVDKLYDEYLELVSEQNKIIDDLKKK